MKNLATLLPSILLALPAAAQSALAVPYGASCYGLTLTSTLPTIGSVMDFTLTGVPPPGFGILGLGLASTAPFPPFLPVPWDPLTCLLHVVAPAPYWMSPLGASTTTLALPIPNNPALVGLTFYAQGFSVFSVPWWLSSNGIEATVGF